MSSSNGITHGGLPVGLAPVQGGKPPVTPATLTTPPVSEEHLARKYGFVAYDDDFWGAPEPEFLIPEILAEAGVALMYSRSGQGKSLLAQDWAVGFAVKCAVMGKTVERMRVLYIDKENSQRDWRDRLVSMGLSRDDSEVLREYLHYSVLGDWKPLDGPDGGTEVLDYVVKNDIKLVIMDTNSKMVVGEENGNDTWNDLHRYTTVPLKREGVAVIQLDHTGKNEDAGPRGGSSKMNNMDVVWKLWASTNGEYVTLKCEKDRPGMYGGEGHEVKMSRRKDPLVHAPIGEGTSFASLVEQDIKHEQRLDQIIDNLDRLGLPPGVGRAKALEALKKADLDTGGRDLADAVKERKRRHGLVVDDD